MKAEESYTLLNVKTKLKLLLGFKNNWRKRYVEVYEHPSDTNMLVSVGYPFANPEDPVICEEPRSAYARRLEAPCSCRLGTGGCARHKDYD